MGDTKIQLRHTHHFVILHFKKLLKPPRHTNNKCQSVCDDCWPERSILCPLGSNVVQILLVEDIVEGVEVVLLEVVLTRSVHRLSILVAVRR